MKSRIITFLIAMGIPVSTISTQGVGCVGTCGNCTFSCTPGIFALLLLSGKYFFNKYLWKGGSINE